MVAQDYILAHALKTHIIRILREILPYVSYVEMSLRWFWLYCGENVHISKLVTGVYKDLLATWIQKANNTHDQPQL